MLIFLRSLLFYFGYFLTLVVHATLCVIVGWALPVKARFRFVTLWNGFVIWWLTLACGVGYRVTGLEHVPQASYVMLSNHQSPWETLFLYYRFLPICSILKRELLYIPFFGWALGLLHPIPIDRRKGRNALQSLLTEGPKRLHMGLSVLVFPEGTRIEVGREKKFQAGGAELAIKAGAVVVPVAHNAGVCWPAHTFGKRPGLVDVVVGKPIPTAGREARELTEEVEAWVRQTLAQIG